MSPIVYTCPKRSIHVIKPSLSETKASIPTPIQWVRDDLCRRK